MNGRGKCHLLKKRFEQNSSYAKASMDEIFTKEMMDGAIVLKCSEARSG